MQSFALKQRLTAGCCEQKTGAEDEEEQVLSVLMSKGATEAALSDEMGRLRVQEEVLLMASLVLAQHCLSTPSPGHLQNQEPCAFSMLPAYHTAGSC